jgi:DNA (cytosine-5)-methyltransferase 1
LDFIDLFAGMGGFHLALKRLGHRCVFASEIDPSLCDLYEKNFGLRPQGDVRQISDEAVPEHGLLCAGFPCQPFSKAGEQEGTKCQLWGDLFEKHVLRILAHRKPDFLLMENVANLLIAMWVGINFVFNPQGRRPPNRQLTKAVPCTSDIPLTPRK